MDDNTLRLVLQITGAAVGGGILEFIRRLLNRRAEMKKLDSQANATALDSANSYIKTLQEGEKAVRVTLAQLTKRLDDKDSEIDRMAELLATERRENSRIQQDLSVVRADLAVAQLQITELSRRLTGGI